MVFLNLNKYSDECSSSRPRKEKQEEKDDFLLFVRINHGQLHRAWKVGPMKLPFDSHMFVSCLIRAWGQKKIRIFQRKRSIYPDICTKS